jgi:hypothetical protein
MKVCKKCGTLYNEKEGPQVLYGGSAYKRGSRQARNRYGYDPGRDRKGAQKIMDTDIDRLAAFHWVHISYMSFNTAYEISL